MVVGVDVSVAVNATQWACLAAAGVQWAATRAWHSYGAFDNNSIGNLAGAHAANIAAVDVYLFPCPGKDAGEQANDMLSALQSSKFGKVWIDVEYNPSRGCGWPSSGEDGCTFLRELTGTLLEGGVPVGYYASHHGWNKTVGLDCTIEGEYSLPLWYPHYDQRADSCSDFMPFGGWQTASYKQYTDKAGTDAIAKCGVSVDTSASCDSTGRKEGGRER